MPRTGIVKYRSVNGGVLTCTHVAENLADKPKWPDAVHVGRAIHYDEGGFIERTSPHEPFLSR